MAGAHLSPVAVPGEQGVASRRPPPRATTQRPRGRARQGTHRCRRGLPLDRRVVGLHQADGMPHAPSRAKSSLIPRLVSRGASKLRIRCLVAGSQPVRVPRPRAADVHQLVHQRLRTTMNILGPKSEDMARPWTNVHVVVGAASDYESDGQRSRSLGPSVTRWCAAAPNVCQDCSVFP